MEQNQRINWLIRRATSRDIPRIIELTQLHKAQEMPYTLDMDLTRAFIDQIFVAYNEATDEIGCFEHVIEAPFKLKDRIFLLAIKQFPYTDQVQPGELVNCCQSSGVGKGSHRAMYEFQAKNWPAVWTWISVKSPLWPVLKDLGWETKGQPDEFLNIWKKGISFFQLGMKSRK